MLYRLNPFADDHPLFRGTTTKAPVRELAVTSLAERYPSRALRHLEPYFVLRGFDVATVTIDLRKLSLNITYFDHWLFGIYEGCQPCPPRYGCRPSLTGNFTCDATPSFQDYHGIYCADCCKCQRHTMPMFFDRFDSSTLSIRSNNVAEHPYLDNKHRLLQITITALRPADVVFTLELMHGMFVRDFTDNFRNTADLRCGGAVVRWCGASCVYDAR